MIRGEREEQVDILMSSLKEEARYSEDIEEEMALRRGT